MKTWMERYAEYEAACVAARCIQGFEEQNEAYAQCARIKKELYEAEDCPIKKLNENEQHWSLVNEALINVFVTKALLKLKLDYALYCWINNPIGNPPSCKGYPEKFRRSVKQFLQARRLKPRSTCPENLVFELFGRTCEEHFEIPQSEVEETESNKDLYDSLEMKNRMSWSEWEAASQRLV